MTDFKFSMPPGRRIVLLILLFVAGSCVTGVLASIITHLGGNERLLATTRISAVLQDILMLVVPAVAAAVLICRRPASLLSVDRPPRLWPSLLAVATLVVATPLMSMIIIWNNGLHLPESMAQLETALRATEQNATEAVEFLLGPHTIGNLVVSLLIVALMAGFCEELFFRGAMQRILHTSPISKHAAIWITAVLFSLVHFQIFGFVPRLLLGAYFGYLLVWSGSVWLPMIVHVANNSLFIILRYTTGSSEPDLGSKDNLWIMVATSIILTSWGLWQLHHSLTNTTKE